MAYIISRTSDGKVQFIDQYLYDQVAAVKGTVDERINLHLHEDQQVAPWGADPIQLVSGAGAYNFGNYGNDIIAAGAIAYLYDLHWAVISAPDTNAHYEVEFVHGAGDEMIAHAKFTRSNVFIQSITIPLMTKQLPAGSRVRARLRDSAGGSSCLVCVFYHEYPTL